MKVALLGAWHVHAADYSKEALAHGELLGFYEKDDALAQQYQKTFNVPRFATRQELLDSDAEGVIVCSATCDHTEDILAAANAKKQIFTEKVLALTEEDCDKIEAALAQNGVSLTISLFQKYIGSRMAVKEVVDSGELGKINYMRFRNCHSGSTRDWLPIHFYNRAQCGGGAMIDLGAHGMYLTEWLLGVPTSAASTFTVSCEAGGALAKNTDGVEDNAVTVMRFENGAIAINETGFISECSPVVLEVHGELGYVRMENDRVVKCTKDTNHATVELTPPSSLPSPIRQFLSGDVLPGCAIREAKALTKMMVMAYANVM